MHDLISKLNEVPAHVAATRAGTVSFRVSAKPFELNATTHVLLHGIGSGSGSWLKQLSNSSLNINALAWDAPGYGQSSNLSSNMPTASDYASAFWSWIDALNITTPITLVGHSLGALMAARATVLRPQKISQLILLAPALGYGKSTVAERDAITEQRLSTIRELGPTGMAEKRSAALLSDQAAPELKAYVAHIMSQIKERGYEQAARLLTSSDLLADLTQLKSHSNSDLNTRIQVACGDLDTITPPAKCQLAADAAHTKLLSLGASGHACALETSHAVNELLERASYG